MDKRDVFLKCGIVEPLPYLLDGGAPREKIETSKRYFNFEIKHYKVKFISLAVV